MNRQTEWDKKDLAYEIIGVTVRIDDCNCIETSSIGVVLHEDEKDEMNIASDGTVEFYDDEGKRELTEKEETLRSNFEEMQGLIKTFYGEKLKTLINFYTNLGVDYDLLGINFNDTIEQLAKKQFIGD